MVSDTYANTSPPADAKADADRVRDAASREAASARAEAERAGATLKDGASRLASTAKEKALEGADSGKAIAASNLDDFTAAIRRASDELGERDQSMAANLVRQAASGLEDVSKSIHGKSVQDLTRSAADFARRQPAAFLIGAALAGVALGRFARASSEHDHRDTYGDDRYGRDVRNDVRTGPGSAYAGVAPTAASTTSVSRPSSPSPMSGSGTATGPGAVTTPAGATSTPGSAYATPSAPSSVTGGSSASGTSGTGSSPYTTGGDNVR